jgi:predicted nucleic acid-binding protein
MSVDAFLDTNVLIYHLDATDPRKHDIAEGLVRDALARSSACISAQVFQECLNTVLRKAEIKLSVDAARSYLDTVLLPLMQATPTAAVYHRALDVQSRWKFSFYDSLIIATALGLGCKTLWSEDLQHGQKIEGLIIRNPFV